MFKLMNKYRSDIIIFIFIAVCVQSCAEDREYGSTDDVHNKIRSGLIINIDHLTGCEYVRTLFGGPTPRMSENGKSHLGCGNVEPDLSSFNLKSIETWRSEND